MAELAKPLTIFAGMNTGLKFGLDPKVLNGIFSYSGRSSDHSLADFEVRCHQRE